MALQLKYHDLSLTYAEQLNNICKPLLALGIVYFHYIKSFQDHSRISLSNQPDWVEYYYDQQFYATPTLNKDPTKNITANYFWSDFVCSPVLQALREKFNIGNGITLVRKSAHGCEFYYFGAHANNPTPLSLFLNNLYLLERFIFYFMDQAAAIVQYAEKHRIYLPHQANAAVNQVRIPSPSLSPENFVQQTPIKKYRFHQDNLELSLSLRQMQCILGLMEGKSAKEIAAQHHLSIRTVENYIDYLKNKLNCPRKVDIIHKLQKLFLIHRDFSLLK